MVRSFSSSPHVVCLLAMAFAAACVPMRPPMRSSGPSVSREGVQVAVTRQRCSETVEPDYPGNDLTEEVLEVRVRNGTPTQLTVHRDAFRLVTPDGYSLETLTLGVGDPMTIAGGETRAFELRYMTRGSLQCAREMRLETGRGITSGANSVEVGSVRFTPARAI